MLQEICKSKIGTEGKREKERESKKWKKEDGYKYKENFVIMREKK